MFDHDAHVKARERVILDRSLIRAVIRLRAERGTAWLRGWVRGWKRWPVIREDFWAQVRVGNTGAWGEWR